MQTCFLASRLCHEPDNTADVETDPNTTLSRQVGSQTPGSLQTATASDPVFAGGSCLFRGRNSNPGRVKSIMTELSVVNCVSLKGNELVIPASMCKEILKHIHHGYLGLNKSKLKARKLDY